MAARVPHLSAIVLPESSTSQDGADDVLAVLRAEHDKTEDGRSRSRLLSEMAAIYERRDDLASAARDELAATNADPTLIEPLESLIGIARRRRSQKNLSKLVERLARVAQTSSERQRAAFELALQERRDEQFEDARQTLERALSEAPDDAASWILLETLAVTLKDPALRERALTGRAGVGNDPEWRSLLLLDCARLRLEAGDTDTCLALHRQANDEFPSLRALEQWERSALAGKRYDEAREAAEAIAALVGEAQSEPEQISERALPRSRRTEVYAATALLRAAEWSRRAGDPARSASLLAAASVAAPNEPLIRAGHIATADASREELLRAELERRGSGPVAAALWLRLADARAERGEHDAAEEAIDAALSADPDSLRARALRRSRLARKEHAGELVAELEREEADGAERTQRLLLAALVTALNVDSTTDEATKTEARAHARTLLARAREAGAGALQIAELGRAIASHTGDAAWYEQASSELLPHVAEAERRELLLELGRIRLLRHDIAGAEDALGAEGGSLLSTALSCYAAPHVAHEEGANEPALRTDQAARFESALRNRALYDSAAPHAPADELSRAILGAALANVKQKLESGARGAAQAKLRALHEELPSNPLVAAALADLSGDEDASGAALVLSRAAEPRKDDSLAAAWYLRAAVYAWRTGQRAVALDYVKKAHERVPAAAHPWLSWVEPLVAPNDVGKRRQLLDTLGEDRGAFVRLERAALELAEDPHAVLDVATLEADDAALAWLSLLSMGGGANESARAIFREVSEQGVEPERVLAALDYARAHGLRAGEPSSERALDAARAWAERSNELDAALAWLTEARALGRAQEEARARRQLGLLLGSPELIASGTLLAALGASLEGDSVDSELERALSSAAPEAASLADVPKAVRWARLELSTPGDDADARGAALEGVAQPAGESDALQDEALRATLLALSACNRAARGEHAEALARFRDVAGRLPSDPMAWEGVRKAAAALGDASLEAEACAELAKCVAADETAAAFWEHAGVLYQDVLNDEKSAEEAFGASLSRDYGRDTAFERLFRLVRARGDQARLLELVEGRLGVTQSPARLAELLWEKSRLSRRLDDLKGSLEAIDALLALEPGHLGALALGSEIHLTEERFDRAAELLARLSEQADAPAEQRRLSALAAADLYETKLQEPARSLEILRALGARLQNELELVERRALAATHAEQWPEAAQAFEELRDKSADREQRSSAAAFVLAISRDKLHDAERARSAAHAILRERADDPDALDYLLTSGSGVSVELSLLERARDACLEHLEQNALDESRLRLLLRLSEALGDAARSLVALGALSALGVLSEPEQRHLDAMRTAALAEPRAVLAAADVESLAAGHEGAVSREASALLARLSPALTRAFEPSLDALGVTPSGRVDPFSDDPARAAVSPWATAIGLSDFELYVGGRDEHGVYALSLDLPTLVLGKSVKPPFDATQRAAIFAALFSLLRGTTPITNRPPDDGAALLAMVARVAGEAADTSVSPELEERFRRALEPELAASLPELWRAARAELGERTLSSLCANVSASALSVGALATGEPSATLHATPWLKSAVAAEPSQTQTMRDVLAFTLSPELVRFRDALGMGTP